MPGHRPVGLDELYTEISRAMSTEVQEIEESVDAAANIVTNEVLSNIRYDSPEGATGEYKKGWKRKKLKYSYVVYNKKKPYITHLLEFGHDIVGRDGKRKGKSKAIPHIKKNEQNAVEKFEDLCIEIVSGGLRLKK